MAVASALCRCFADSLPGPGDGVFLILSTSRNLVVVPNLCYSFMATACWRVTDVLLKLHRYDDNLCECEGVNYFLGLGVGCEFQNLQKRGLTHCFRTIAIGY